jgi:hypothetical protein
MRICLLVLPLLLSAGCRKSTPLASGEPALPPAAEKPELNGGLYNDFAKVTLQLSGGLLGKDDTLEVRPDSVTFIQKGFNDKPATTRSAPFSADEKRELARLLQRVDWINNTGKFHQNGVYDAYLERITVSFGPSKDANFIAENYGFLAPESFKAVEKYLLELQARKFSPPQPRDAYSDVSALTFHVTGGFAGTDETLTLRGDRLTFTRTRPALQREATLSAAEWRELAGVLRRADFIKLVGKYEQKDLSDGFNETVTVQLGEGDKAKTYVVENYGDRAPAAYYDVTKYLRELIANQTAKQ